MNTDGNLRTTFGLTPLLFLEQLRMLHKHLRTTLPISAALVLMWLSSHGRARQRTIVTDLKLPKSTVSRHLIELEHDGWVDEDDDGMWRTTQKWDNARLGMWRHLAGVQFFTIGFLIYRLVHWTLPHI